MSRFSAQSQAGTILTGLIFAFGWTQSLRAEPLWADSLTVEDSVETTIDKQIDEIVQSHVPKSGPGAALMVLKGGEPVFQKGYGLADVDEERPISRQTRFRLASVSKQFTAACVLLLVDDGRLSLDDSLRDIFPAFPEYAQEITVRHLLHHTGGLKDYMGLFGKKEIGTYMPTSMDVVDLLAEQQETDFAAGEKYAYSNSGYVTLAMIVQEIAGEPFAEFAKRELFDPLGMTQTVYQDERQRPIEGAVKSYRPTFSGWADADHHQLNRVVGDGAVFSNLIDFVQWEKALREGKYLSPELMKETFESGKLNDGSKTDYGYGWIVAELLGREAVSHTGGWLGFRTIIASWVKEELTVVVFCNWTDANPGAIAQDVARVYFEADEKEGAP